METKDLARLKEMNTSCVAYELGSLLRGKSDSNNLYYDSIAFASALYIKEVYEIDVFTQGDDFYLNHNISLETVEFIRNQLIRHEFFRDSILRYENKFSPELLLSYILFNQDLTDRNDATPMCVSQLALEILNINKDDVVYDLCSGEGNFLIDSAVKCAEAEYHGVELNYNNIDLAQLKFDLLDLKCEFILSNALSSYIKADKIFSNYPLGLKGIERYFAIELMNEYNLPHGIMDRCSSDWIFNSIIVSGLKENGKGVAIVSDGSTWNMGDKNIRKFFLENGFIEAVISLPNGIFKPYMSVSTSMIVFSKNNERVRLVDASQLFEKSFRKNIMTDAHIQTVLNCLDEDSDISVLVDVNELAKEDYQLNPKKHLAVLPEFEDGVKFSSIIKNITRGSQIKAEVLNEYKSDVPTNVKYLMLSNINKGSLSIGKDQYLKSLPDKTEKYCIKNNSIVLSKTSGSEFKSVVVNVPEGETILANGNMYVIELDETKADPYYIQSFLQSPTGQMVIKSLTAGAVIQTIPVKNLKEMVIPLPDLKTQQDKGIKYVSAVDEIEVLKRKLEKVYLRMEHIFEED